MEDERVSYVLAVLPSLDTVRVKALLAKYGSVEEVINRCLDGVVEEPEIIEVASAATTDTLEFDGNEDLDRFDYGYDDREETNNVAATAAGNGYRIIDVDADRDDFNTLNYNDLDLPDIPDIPENIGSQEVAYFSETVSVTEKVAVAPLVEPTKPKGRGRKKKEDAPSEPLIKEKKKKLPTNVASVEVQIGAGINEKSANSGIGDAIFKALEVNGGVFEKNAALPCPCNVTLWEDALHPFAVRWVYHKPLSVLENDDESDSVYAAPGSEFYAELQPELCILLPLDDFIALCRPGARDHDLTAFCRQLISPQGATAYSASISNKEQYRRIVIITPDPEQYFKQRQTDQRRQFRQKIVGDGASGTIGGANVTLDDVETAIATLDFAEPPLGIPVTVSFSTSSEHAAAIVRCITKAVCDRPAKSAKRQWDSALVMEPGSTVNPAEKPFELWCRQLEQLPLVSSDVASAIAARYPTPMSLHCAAAADGSGFVADLEIRRGAGVLERTRRVGPETSRRLHMLFTTGVDPETVFE